MPYPGWRAIIPVLGSTLLIAAGSSAAVNQQILSLRPFVGIGLISYPLYLWHWPLLSFVRIVESGNSEAKFILSAAALSFPLAWITYKLVEQPIRRGLNLRTKIIGLSSGMTVVAALGLLLFINGGLDRSRTYVSSIASSWKDVKESCEGIITTITKNDICIVSTKQDPAEPIDLVVGDSHASAFASGLIHSDIGGKNMFMVSLPGCPPFISVDRYESGLKRSCGFDEIIPRLSKGRGINNLILIGRYAFYASGDGYGSDGGLKPGTVAITRQGAGGQDYPSILTEGLEATLKTIKAQKITLLLQAPELGFDIKSCEDTRPVRLSNHVRSPCAVKRVNVEERQRIYRPMFDSVLKRFPAVAIIDPMQDLCDTSYCYGMKGNQMLYIDDNHVSPIGAAAVLSHLTP